MKVKKWPKFINFVLSNCGMREKKHKMLESVIILVGIVQGRVSDHLNSGCSSTSTICTHIARENEIENGIYRGI